MIEHVYPPNEERLVFSEDCPAPQLKYLVHFVFRDVNTCGGSFFLLRSRRFAFTLDERRPYAGIILDFSHCSLRGLSTCETDIFLILRDESRQ